MKDIDIYKITGNSMFPLLQKGRDAVIIDRVPFASLQRNDLVVFKDLNNPVSEIVCHRVFKIFPDKKSFIEKGDHHFGYSYVDSSRYVGKVSYILKDGVIYSMNCRKNKWINNILGVLVYIYHIRLQVYLFINSRTMVENLCKDKLLRDKFFGSYSILAGFLIKHMEPNKI